MVCDSDMSVVPTETGTGAVRVFGQSDGRDNCGLALSVSAISAGMLPAGFREFSCMPSVDGREQGFQELPCCFHRVDFDGFTRGMRAVNRRAERDDVK